MADLVEVPIGTIDFNPYRLLGTYPFKKAKIETLMRSIADVGLWEGVIARPYGNRYQLAFGHHRIEAARGLKLPTVSLIVRDLTDAQMLQFMGRENGEDYNADYLVLLETWEAVSRFLATASKKAQPLEIASFLGWTRIPDKKDVQINDTASACYAGYALISGGHLSRNDLQGLSVAAARQLVERAQTRIETIERLGHKGRRPAKDIEADKHIVASAAKSVARDIRDHSITQRDIRGEIDYRAYKGAREKGRQSPLFSGFADDVAKGIHKMLVADKTAEKLQEMEQGLPDVELDEDFASLRRVDFALAEHETVTGKWRTRLTRKGEKVAPFKLLKGG